MTKLFRNAPLPVILLIASFLCPSELSLNIADIRLPPHRVVILLLAPYAIVKVLLQQNCRLLAFDILFALFGLWTLIAFVQHGANGGLVYGGSQTLESFGSYIIARAYIRDQAAFVGTLRLVSVATIASGLIALPEMFLKQHVAHEVMRLITGDFVPTRSETRFGLMRAYGTFDHPIHLGTFCGAMFALFWYASRTWHARLTRAAVVAIATFTALSSAPLLGLFLQIALISWEMVTRQIKGRVVLTVGAVTAIVLISSMLSSRTPFAFIATNLTIDSWTGYYRLVIWEYGAKTVYNYPWFGIGLAEWERPWWMHSSSVDAFWLLIAMRIGLPGLVMLVLAVVLLVYRTSKGAKYAPDPLVRRYAKAWTISLIALVLVGCTVHFWNVLMSFFFFFLGLAGWIADPASKRYLARAAMKRNRAKSRTNRRRSMRPRPQGVPEAAAPA